MNIIYVDVDALRPDHLGCYGYHRNTSPNIDSLAERGVRFDNYYASDAPCAPSRSAMFSSRYGIHNGVVNHGGIAGDKRPIGEDRPFNNHHQSYQAWVDQMRFSGFHTAMISPFPGRHTAWHVQEGFLETHDTGKHAGETADDVFAAALDWLKQNGTSKENWFLYVNFWDPHTPYRTPESYGNPFKDEPASPWLTQAIIDQQKKSFGPMSARNVPAGNQWEGLPETIETPHDFKRWIDGYDTAIRYVDDQIGNILNTLEEQGFLDETMIILTADHGENQGELNVYGDHQTADYVTSRIPCVIAGPGVVQNHVDQDFHYQIDIGPTLVNMVGSKQRGKRDGQSFLPVLTTGEQAGRGYLVLSQAAWSCQRSVRFDNWIMIRTYHDGLKDYPDIMLFDVEKDPHETTNVAQGNPAIVGQAMMLLDQWYAEQMVTSDYPIDPMWQVIHEGGPYHTRGDLDKQLHQLNENEEFEAANRLEARHKHHRRFEK